MTQNFLKTGLFAFAFIASAGMAAAHSGGLDGRLLVQSGAQVISVKAASVSGGSTSGGSGIFKEWLLEKEMEDLGGKAGINGRGGCSVWDDPKTSGGGCTQQLPVRILNR